MLDPYSTLHAKINSQWIKDLKLLEEDIDANFMTLDQARGFLDMTPKHKTKIKKSKLELVKIAKESNTTYQLNNNNK